MHTIAPVSSEKFVYNNFQKYAFQDNELVIDTRIPL